MLGNGTKNAAFSLNQLFVNITEEGLRKKVVATHIEALKDGSEGVRLNASAGLGRFSDTRAVPPLITCLKDTSLKVRRNAIISLGELGDRRAIQPLSACLEDQEESVRKSAKQVLEGFGLQLKPTDRFEYQYYKLNAILEKIEETMPTLMMQRESDIKEPNSIYSCYHAMEPAWRSFTGSRSEAYNHIMEHFRRDHPDTEFSYTIQSDGRGQVNIIANTPRVGLQHFIWRTLEDNYILMLSSDIS
jgi:hypothetical protein